RLHQALIDTAACNSEPQGMPAQHGAEISARAQHPTTLIKPASNVTDLPRLFMQAGLLRRFVASWFAFRFGHVPGITALQLYPSYTTGVPPGERLSRIRWPNESRQDCVQTNWNEFPAPACTVMNEAASAK